MFHVKPRLRPGFFRTLKSMIFASLYDDLSPGRGVKVEGPSGPIAVFQDSTGQVYAVDDLCGHLGASLSEGTCTDGVIDCWLHHGKYSAVTGETEKYPARGTLRTYPVENRDGELWVDTENSE